MLATLLAYQPAWKGKPLWDDDKHLTPPHLQSLDGLVHIWSKPGATQQYYPLTFSAFWVFHKLWGDSTLGYHLANILLHAGSGLLVFMILRGLEVPGARLAAVIFALHPVQVESVAWMTELKNTLSGFLYLASMLAYLRFDRAGKRTFYIIALGMFVLGLTAKTAIATLPAALLVVSWWKRGRLAWKQDVWPLVPFLCAGLAAGLFTMVIERQLFGAAGSGFNFSFLERCLMAGHSICFHLGLLFWPVNLTFMYPCWTISQTAWWQYLYPAAVALLLVGLWAMRRKNRGPLAGLLFFMGTLFPALGFFNAYSFRYSFVNDHHQYLAGLGIITLVSAGIGSQFKRGSLWGRFLGTMLCLTLLAALATLTWRQSRIYTDMETLWRTTIARNPTCWMAHNNLGSLLLEKGRVEESISCFRKTLGIRPNDEFAQCNLGTALFANGQMVPAIEQYQQALKFVPDYAAGHRNLACALAQKGRFTEALPHYEAAVRFNPTNAWFANDLAWFLATCPEAKIRNGVRAIATAQRAIRLSGGNEPMFVGTLAAACAAAGRFEEAMVQYENVLALMPTNASFANNLAWLLATCPAASVRNGDRAIELAQRAVQLSGGNEPAFIGTLAAAYAEAGRFLEATATGEQARALALTNGNLELAEKNARSLALYRAQQPYHETTESSAEVSRPQTVP